jgi:hypothetical protein
MGIKRSEMLLGLAAAAGAVGVAAMMSTATAASARADDSIYVPDPATFNSAPEPGYPPLVDVLQGTETWDQTGNLPAGITFYDFDGVDTHTTFFGSFTNDYFLTSGFASIGGISSEDFILPAGTQIDLMDYGLGFENQWVDIPAVGMDPGSITDTLITPFGDFTL